MNRAFLVLKEKLIQEINPVLPLVNYQTISKTENGIEALRIAQRLEPNLIICSWDIQGISALDLVQNLIQANLCPVILVLEQKDQNSLQYAVKTGVHQIITAPIRAVDIIAGVVQAEHRYHTELMHRDEIRKLNDEVTTRKILYQAILKLIPLGLEEEAAYALIRKQAMTTRKSIRSVAVSIVKGLWLPTEEK
ncbi:response regulator receiver and ANTAR domain protein [Syntrophobotulus glycolicus DSM 8271]|uniref:Stage 0 sporulation protein A homolog n=1 Tax=Syntrophobotulus glycolicus (strain DSM 8271 / FlGlyR) TaxID=645991 RepID=F0SZK0_SYNGF|nr:ANTAR domain-containing protein [Syntrophobotulus glycolicus]ADY56086.1 response regulator receiver and ANTAR domain protein [Syntrophobotulus glycolicus DSM 8271]